MVERIQFVLADPAAYNSDLLGSNTSAKMLHIMGVTNHFLIGFEAHFMEWNSLLTELKWPRTQNRIAHGPKGKSTTIVLLKEHSNNMTSKRHTWYTHGSVPRLALFREISYYSRSS